MKGLLILILLLSFVVNAIIENSDKKVKCKGGELKKGKCICPQGKKILKGNCIDTPRKCINGLYRFGRCMCKSGFTLKGGKECVKTNCEGGIFKNGRCQCPSGKTLIGNKCAESLHKKCEGGKFGSGKCNCPVGKRLQNGKCSDFNYTPCRPGQKYMDGRCVNWISNGAINRADNRYAQKTTTRMAHRFL